MEDKLKRCLRDSSHRNPLETPLPPALRNFWVGVFSNVVLGFRNFAYDFGWVGGDVVKTFPLVSIGGRVRRHESKDPHRGNFLQIPTIHMLS